MCVRPPHDSGNVKWTFPVNVGEDAALLSQKGKCHAGLLTLPLFLSTYPSPVWLDSDLFFFFKEYLLQMGRSREKSERHSPPIPRKGLLTFNSTNNIWKSPEM